MKQFNLSTSGTQPFEPGEEELVWQTFKQGDTQAFTGLVTIYYPVLLKYGLRICAEPEVVKDCLHNLFLDIWNRRDRLHEIRSLKAYLLTSLRRQLYKETRRSQWAYTTDELNAYDFQVQFAIESDIIESEIQDENLLKLQANLKQLSKRQREAVYLRFYQDLAYDDIAQIMAINHHSAVNLIYEALKLLRKHWKTLIFLAFLPSL